MIHHDFLTSLFSKCAHWRFITFCGLTAILFAGCGRDHPVPDADAVVKAGDSENSTEIEHPIASAAEKPPVVDRSRSLAEGEAVDQDQIPSLDAYYLRIATAIIRDANDELLQLAEDCGRFSDVDVPNRLPWLHARLYGFQQLGNKDMFVPAFADFCARTNLSADETASRSDLLKRMVRRMRSSADDALVRDALSAAARSMAVTDELFPWINGQRVQLSRTYAERMEMLDDINRRTFARMAELSTTDPHRRSVEKLQESLDYWTVLNEAAAGHVDRATFEARQFIDRYGAESRFASEIYYQVLRCSRSYLERLTDRQSPNVVEFGWLAEWIERFRRDAVHGEKIQSEWDAFINLGRAEDPTGGM